ncbi:Fibronectin type III domain-containing protein [Blastococcus aurantiacus]|uniref:Fibronectin type III domain-containing protein n=1 Tax=Blastococcus aurantiacus TaxID=1550231 RepID=A0A1G7JAH9_9ACTN|nr:fibronectin type III domain-containing protein [Blastococcus aurantiacus]SDF21489.1 Fibronectin type III domain-containing protein [Blastococcus aurantiacus]
MSSRRVRAGLVAAFLLASGLVQAPLTGMPAASAENELPGSVVEQASVTTPGAPRIGEPEPGNRSAVAVWSAPAGDGGSRITGYVVRAYRDDTLVTTVSVGRGARTATVTGLTGSAAYTLDVSARSAAGTGAPSARSAPVTPIGPPAAPGIGAVTRGDRSAVVRWAGPASNGGAPVTGYVVRVYRGKALVKTLNANAVARRLAVTGLTDGVAYTVSVSARNAKGVGTASARSAAVTPGTSTR